MPIYIYIYFNIYLLENIFYQYKECIFHILNLFVFRFPYYVLYCSSYFSKSDGNYFLIESLNKYIIQHI